MFHMKQSHQQITIDYFSDNILIGSARLNNVSDLFNDNKKIFELEYIFIKNDFQRKGYGSKLLGYIKKVVSQELITLIVDAVPQNMEEKELVNFYLKNDLIHRSNYFIPTSIVTISHNENCALYYPQNLD